MLSLLDPDYPKLLASIYDPPLILYVKGTLIPEDQAALAIVGTRHPSAYGIRTAGRFASELAARGLTIVSGLARGIDGEAHRAALRAKGRTIAVLGSGLDVIYPEEHRELFAAISEAGAVVSEFPLGTEPAAFNFPRRNRVISGLSIGALVVEASRRSGSLITASVAAEEGREVYVIPGPIDSLTSQGTNDLIQHGARLVTSPDEIIEDLSPQIRPLVKLEQETPADQGEAAQDPILKWLSKTPLAFDELAVKTAIAPEELHSRLTALELKGSLKRLFGGAYARR
jgi:DNA processing protein